MHHTAPTAIIVFDGTCVLCSRWTRFVLRFDRQAHFHLAAMQTATGRRLLLEHGLDPDDPNSFLVIDQARSWQDSAALIQVLRHCGWYWRWIGKLLWLCPKPLRDAAYRLVARHRYRWFGRQSLCVLPDAEQSRRFLD